MNTCRHLPFPVLCFLLRFYTIRHIGAFRRYSNMHKLLTKSLSSIAGPRLMQDEVFCMVLWHFWPPSRTVLVSIRSEATLRREASCLVWVVDFGRGEDVVESGILKESTWHHIAPGNVCARSIFPSKGDLRVHQRITEGHHCKKSSQIMGS